MTPDEAMTALHDLRTFCEKIYNQRLLARRHNSRAEEDALNLTIQRMERHLDPIAELLAREAGITKEG